MDAEALRVQVMGYAALHPSYETMRQRVGWVEAPTGAGTHRGQVMGYASLHPSYEAVRLLTMSACRGASLIRSPHTARAEEADSHARFAAFLTTASCAFCGELL